MKRSISRHACPTLVSVEAFEKGCDVAKNGDDIDCGTCPGVACHVKDATRVFNCLGNMGKLPTSAWLRLWRGGGVQVLLDEVCREGPSPTKLPQAGAEEASAGLEAAARKERMKERTPRVDWAELLRRTFDFDVFACVRCGGRRLLAYVKQSRGGERLWSAWDCPQQVRA